MACCSRTARVTRWRFEAARSTPLSQRLYRRARRQALFDSALRFPRAPAPAAPPLGRGAVPPSPTRTPVWCSAERWPPAALSPRRRPRPPARNAPVGAPNRRDTPPSRRSPAAFQCRERRRRNTRYSLKWPHQSPPFSQKGAHEGRRQWRKQAVVSPVKQGTSQVRFAHEARRPC